MKLNKSIVLRISSEDQETLKKLGNNKRLTLGSYCRYILGKHINEENDKKK